MHLFYIYVCHIEKTGSFRSHSGDELSSIRTVATVSGLKKKVGVRSQQIVCVEGKEEVFLLLKDGGGYLFGAQLKLSQDV